MIPGLILGVPVGMWVMGYFFELKRPRKVWVALHPDEKRLYRYLSLFRDQMKCACTSTVCPMCNARKAVEDWERLTNE